MLGMSHHTTIMVPTHNSIVPIMCITPRRHPALRVPTHKSTSHPHPSKRRGIERRASYPSALDSPTHLAREHSLAAFHLASPISEWHIAVQRDVVESEIPYGRIHHSVGAEGEHGPDDGAGDAVIPVVEFVDGERTGDEGRGEDGGVDGD